MTTRDAADKRTGGTMNDDAGGKSALSEGLGPLPEPVAHQVVARGVTAKLAVRADVAEEWADNCRREGAYGASVRTLYTADQMRAYAAAALAAEREKWRELAQRVAHQGNARGLEGLKMLGAISKAGAIVSREVDRA